MTSIFRGVIAAAALAAAACVAPTSASASVELQDYVFSTDIDLFHQPEHLNGSFTLSFDDATNMYDVTAINFRIPLHTFQASNTFAGASGADIILFGSDGVFDSGDFARFQLKFAKSPVLFNFIDINVTTCTEFGSFCTDNSYSSTGTVTRLGGAIPEPATWALMIGGFSLAGATLRRRRAATAAA